MQFALCRPGRAYPASRTGVRVRTPSWSPACCWRVPIGIACLLCLGVRLSSNPRSLNGSIRSPRSEQSRVGFHVDRLAAQGPLLSEPYTKQLDGKLRELRFYLGSRQTRVTYWIAPGRVIVLLTVFTKMRQNERHEVARARRALARCMDEHGMTGDAR